MLLVVSSIFINILALTGSIFMLQLYDRVISSRHEETLLVLVMMVAVFYAFYGLIDAARSRVQSAYALEFEERYRSECLTASVGDYGLPEQIKPRNNALEDLEAVRSFLTSPAALVRYDIWFTALFLGVLWAMHWYMLAFGLIAMLIMVLWATRQYFATRALVEDLSYATLDRRSFTETVHRTAEVVRTMGMLEPVTRAWSMVQDSHAKKQLLSSDTNSWYGSIGKSMRFALQSGMLAVGAWLVITDQVSAGYMIAGSIILGRALAPIDIAIASAKSFVQYRQANARMMQRSTEVPVGSMAQYSPPDAPGFLEADNLSVGPRGIQRVMVRCSPIKISKGECILIFGKSGAGKTTLLRTLAGGWVPKSGSVVIDGRDLSKIDDSERRQTVGFLEQTTSIIDGSLGENISMFDNLVPQNLIASAADLSGLRPLIDKLPLGFDTNIGHDGINLSAGELQRLGLARAYCHRPKVLFLDEPSANLDEEGDKDLNNYIHQAKYTGRIVIVVSHYVPSGFPFDRTIFVDDGTATFVELTEKGTSDG